MSRESRHLDGRVRWGRILLTLFAYLPRRRRSLSQTPWRTAQRITVHDVHDGDEDDDARNCSQTTDHIQNKGNPFRLSHFRNFLKRSSLVWILGAGNRRARRRWRSSKPSTLTRFALRMYTYMYLSIYLYIYIYFCICISMKFTTFLPLSFSILFSMHPH